MLLKQFFISLCKETFSIDSKAPLKGRAGLNGT